MSNVGRANPGGIRAMSRAPLTQAAVGVASIIMAGASQAQAQEALPTIDVQAQGGTGYQPPANSGISRLPVPLIDTPQTVNVVTQQLAQEQGVRSMEDALRNVTGITFSAGEGGQQGDSPFIRGFTARGDIFRDGIRDPGWYTRDFFSVDRLEVYKGPSSFAFGRGSTGGTINNVSKIADGSTYMDGTLTGAVPFGFRAEVDASGKVSPNVAMRIAAMGQDVDTPDRDNVWTKRWGITPSWVMQVDPRTKLTFNYIYQGEQSVPDYGLPYYTPPTYSTTTGLPTGAGYNGNGTAVLPVQVPRNTFLGFTSGPFADLTETEVHIATAKAEHDFNDAIKLTSATRYMSVRRDTSPTAPRNLGLAGQFGGVVTTPPAGYPTDLMTIGQQHWENVTDNTQLINQTDLLLNFNTGAFQHTMATGFELSHETRHQIRDNTCFPSGATMPICRVSLSDPNPNPNGPVDGGWTQLQDGDLTNLGAYVTDQMKIDQYWELMGSVRYDNLHSSYQDQTGVNLNATDGMFSYRYGVVFHPVKNTSVYYAGGVSYNPSSEFATLPTGTVDLQPERTNSQEVGAKAEVLDRRLTLSAAVFQMEKTNMRVSDPTSLTGAQILAGDALSEGIELGAAGKITDQWALFAGYTLLHTELQKTTDLSQLGRQLPNAPESSFTLWTTYEIAPKWTIGGGATYNSYAYANAQNTEYVPEFWKFDAMVAYKIDDKSSLQLNVYNITDELYYAQYYGGQAVPAPGRWASLTYRIRW